MHVRLIIRHVHVLYWSLDGVLQASHLNTSTFLALCREIVIERDLGFDEVFKLEPLQPQKHEPWVQAWINQPIAARRLLPHIHKQFSSLTKLYLIHLLGHYAPLEQLERYVNFGVNPLTADDNEKTALHYACCAQTCRLPVALRTWIEIDARNPDNLKKVRYLLSLGLNPNAQDRNGDTPLHAAAVAGNYELIEELVTHGSDVTLRNRQGYTAMYLAIVPQRQDSTQNLNDVTEGIDLKTGSNDQTRTQWAVLRERLWVVRKLLEVGASLNVRDYDQRTLMMLAFLEENRHVFYFLLTVGADANVRDSSGRTMLHLAVLNKHGSCFKHLLSSPTTDINARDVNGNTALHVAAATGQYKAIRKLCQAGAHLGQQNNHQRTALHVACWSKHTKAAIVLLINGAAAGAQTSHGNTALHIASQWGQTGVMKYLLLAISIKSVNLRNDVGQTALHVAVTYRQAASVALLASNPTCDVMATDNDNKTAWNLLTVARERCQDNSNYSNNTHDGDVESAAFRRSCTVLLRARTLPAVHVRNKYTHTLTKNCTLR